MNQEDIIYIKNNLKWRFKLSEIYNHYFVLLFPSFIILISFSMFKGGAKFGHLNGEFLITAITILLFGLLFLIFIVNRIQAEKKFKLFELKNLSFEEFEDIIRKSGWSIVESKNDNLILITKTSCFSWGEKITIIKYKDNNILVNSRPERQPITINRDKINYYKLQKLINTTANSRL